MPSEEEKSVFLQELAEETKTEPDPKGEKPKKKKSALALFVVIFVLFLSIIALFIFIMSVGGAGNPILKTFGVPEDGAKEFLLNLVNYSFSFLGIILLLVFAFTLFIGFTTKKELASKRRNSFIFAGASFGLIFLIVIVWLGMYNYVSAIAVEDSGTGGLIEMSVDNDENIKAPIDIQFSAKKIRKAVEASGYDIQGFKWDFGAGFQTLENNDTVMHHFATTGEFYVRVEVVTTEGESEIFSLSPPLMINEAQFEAVPSVGSAPLKVAFDANNVSEDMNPKTFDWDFDGDNIFDQTTQSPTVSHVFEQIGIYQVKLRVVSESGNVKLFERNITIEGVDTDRVQAIIKASETSGQVPLDVFFNAEDSFSMDGKIVSYEWDFNDNTPKVYGETVNHTFEHIGNFNVELTVLDDSGIERTKEVSISVVNPSTIPEAFITTTPSASNNIVYGAVPLTVEFSAANSIDKDDNIIKYEWDFDGDGEIDKSGDTAFYVFREGGDHEVMLRITDADDNEAHAYVIVSLAKENLAAKIIANPETGHIPLTVEFDASESWCDEENCKIVSFEWDFGDGSPEQQAGAQVTHYYPKVGVYEVKLKAFTDNDQEAITTKKIYVREMPLTACFNMSRTEGVAPLTVSFDPSCSMGMISDWQWNFGDGKVVKTRTANHTFEYPGEYKIVLDIFDAKNNTAHIEKTLTVGVAD